MKPAVINTFSPFSNLEKWLALLSLLYKFHHSKKQVMNKGELIDKIAKDTKLTKRQSSDALDAVLNAVTTTLGKGGKVTLVGFGTFSVSKRASRKGRNPRTNKEITIKAKKVAKFKAGVELAKKVNKG
jgi:DNA-binding protein HU-beta